MGRKLAVAKQKYPQPLNEEGQVTKVIRLKNIPHPKNASQEFYLDSLRSAVLTLGTGPAGVGKSFLAMAIACEKLLNNEVSRVVITRPVCEAGENLGFLPGTLEEKISPYLLPLLDALNDLVGPTMAKKLLDDKRIEFAPLAYMRGRTFNYSYVILDEAQNTTIEQMKLFVTRIGENSQFVINGDASQSDLHGVSENGLEWAVRKLGGGKSRNINLVEFRNSDSVRSAIVTEILHLIDSPELRPSRHMNGHAAAPSILSA